jgi:Signal peptidase, peptidase S26
MGNAEVIKRVYAIDDSKQRYYLGGDNQLESADSRQYGPVAKRDILGVVMIHLATATAPPKPRHRYAVAAGWGLAIATIMLAVAQLYRIDELLPETERWAVPGGYQAGVTIVLLLMTAEIFALPALLRMHLSPLAHLVSAVLSVIAPWGWLLISLWLFGTSSSSLLLGTFVFVPWYVSLAVALLWLAASLWVLRMLGYGVYARMLAQRMRRRQ